MKLLERSLPISVLLVEDSLDQRDLMTMALTKAGVRVTAVATGEAAVSALDGVDLVLLDQNLPGMSGLETLEAITSGDRPPSVVMVTGAGSEDLAVRAMKSGAIDYVVKNAGYLRSLPEVVERAWRHHDLTRRAQELQRLSLLLTSSLDRQNALTEIVRGARTLLRLDGCALYLIDDGSVEVAATAGDSGAAELGPTDAASLIEAAQQTERSTALGRFVPLLALDGDVVGALALVTAEPREFSSEETGLARTFASFAAIAVQNVKRLELEQDLVTQLQQTIDARRKLVDSVSHELRTPLACIYGFTETLREQWEDLPEDQKRLMLEKVGQHSQELRDLVDRLLDFGVFERGRVTAVTGEVHLKDQVEHVVKRLEPVLGPRRIEIAVEPLIARGDPVLVQRTLTNLLSNAAKYSEPATPITVKVGRENGHARVEVIDRGIGLVPEEAARVFDPFWRAGDAGVHRTRGVGLGLALVAEYVRGMGGEVGVDSQPGGGSCFYFTLPLL